MGFIAHKSSKNRIPIPTKLTYIYELILSVPIVVGGIAAHRILEIN